MAQTNPAPLATVRTVESDGVTTSAKLRAEGMPGSTIATRCRPGGPWRRLLPGVILLGDSEPTRRQQLRAALYYTGPGSVVSGLDALRASGIPVIPSPEVRVLVPPERRTVPRGFVALERTSRVPPPLIKNGIPYAPVARATLDVARHEPDPARLRRLLTLPVYYGLCTAGELCAELEAGNQRGSAGVREILRDLGSMGETYLQGAARALIRHVPLPPPTWNVTICDLVGHPIGIVDAWWDEVALGWQFGGCRAGPKMNHLALIAAGVVLLRSAPDQLHTQAGRIRRELTSAFASAAKRRRPKVQAFGAVAA
ncbi:MAG TPA: hypothetical protein VJT49_11485 [Amycolatopsis sp.]|uniref:hypothetical protein n=1 Tax=Amycolatopsis sp. TaxID=37632 RepID=UPI002B48B205|nr:hypothetical protein [Amycolatopsis sp.]HKS45713.1 hypothetical protein [Amycolatopsis sp.]